MSVQYKRIGEKKIEMKAINGPVIDKLINSLHPYVLFSFFSIRFMSIFFPILNNVIPIHTVPDLQPSYLFKCISELTAFCHTRICTFCIDRVTTVTTSCIATIVVVVVAIIHTIGCTSEVHNIALHSSSTGIRNVRCFTE